VELLKGGDGKTRRSCRSGRARWGRNSMVAGSARKSTGKAGVRLLFVQRLTHCRVAAVDTYEVAGDVGRAKKTENPMMWSPMYVGQEHVEAPLGCGGRARPPPQFAEFAHTRYRGPQITYSSPPVMSSTQAGVCPPKVAAHRKWQPAVDEVVDRPPRYRERMPARAGNERIADLGADRPLPAAAPGASRRVPQKRRRKGPRRVASQLAETAAWGRGGRLPGSARFPRRWRRPARHARTG